MIRFSIFGLLAFFLCCCNEKHENPKDIGDEQIASELLDAIESRHFTWKDNDFKAHMKTYHPDWRRWDTRENKLLKLKDFPAFWDTIKVREETLKMEITLIDYKLLGDGNTALVHYTNKETFKWIGPESPQGKRPGDIYEGLLRWSDVLVKESGKWLYLGGHRDLSKPENGLVKIN